MAQPRVVLSFLALAGALVACGDDDEGTTAPRSDASVPDASPAPADASPADAGALAAIAAPVNAYLGATVKLDGTPSIGPDGLTYAWSITSAPAGAATNLADATTATPTLAADRPGAYVLALTVAAGGATATTSVTATLVDPAFLLSRDVDRWRGARGRSQGRRRSDG